MRTLILALLPGLLLAACGDDTATTLGATDGTTGTTTTATTASPTGDTPASPTGDSTGEPTTAATDSGDATTADPTATSGTTGTTGTDSSTTGTDSSTTGTDSSTTSTDSSTGDSSSTGDTGMSGICGADGPEVDALLVHDGEDPGCGPLEFTGTNSLLEPGPSYALDSCPCDANCLIPDPWTFTMTAPADWLPGILPACPRIVVERAKSKQGCQLVGVAVWDTSEPPGSPAVYHAGHQLGPIAAVLGQFDTASAVVEECECENCCNVPARYDLTFTALQSELTLAEGASGLLGDLNLGYEITNFQSHLSGLCDDPAAIDWVARRVKAP